MELALRGVSHIPKEDLSNVMIHGMQEGGGRFNDIDRRRLHQGNYEL